VLLTPRPLQGPREGVVFFSKERRTSGDLIYHISVFSLMLHAGRNANLKDPFQLFVRLVFDLFLKRGRS